jgi:uncharacterized protein with HEPN domain
MLDRIQSYTQGVTFEQFEADNLRFDSTLLNLITIGEAIKNIPDDILQQAPEIPWRDIARFRDRAIHRYYSLQKNIIWQVVENDLAPLKTAVERLLLNNPDESKS